MPVQQSARPHLRHGMPPKRRDSMMPLESDRNIPPGYVPAVPLVGPGSYGRLLCDRITPVDFADTRALGQALADDNGVSVEEQHQRACASIALYKDHR